ncbi:hypothetical protein BS47DRAFT_1361424 [Hydnum rufescens UP504]|uniref:Uncharacterized protein n=1 Tax=Hydnum rufescens UP504 TaxID=1448309 RepID=A0A9P6AZV1_9AGAM|nr:hypothetical protein BS47DRAFT_1361424 [Hydnum rufescens UP504]
MVHSPRNCGGRQLCFQSSGLRHWVLLRGIIVSGPTPVLVLSKAPLSDGLVDTVLTMVTPTPILILTGLIMVSFGLMLAGCDLANNLTIRFQHRWYLELLILVAFIIPTIVPGLLWGDYRGGYFYAGAARLLFVHHSMFCVNSLARWLGETPFDDKHTPRDHVIRS